MNDPMASRVDALQRMGAKGPDSTDAPEEMDSDGDGDVSLGEIAEALGNLMAEGNLPEEMMADLTQCQQILSKYASEEEPAPPALDEAEEEAPLPNEGE